MNARVPPAHHPHSQTLCPKCHPCTCGSSSPILSSRTVTHPRNRSLSGSLQQQQRPSARPQHYVPRKGSKIAELNGGAGLVRPKTRLAAAFMAETYRNGRDNDGAEQENYGGGRGGAAMIVPPINFEQLLAAGPPSPPGTGQSAGKKVLTRLYRKLSSTSLREQAQSQAARPLP